jgi:hypothetical protein
LDGHVDSSNRCGSGRGVGPARGDSATGRPAQTRRLIPRSAAYRGSDHGEGWPSGLVAALRLSFSSSS